MKNKKIIVFPLEIKERELDGAITIVIEAIRNNFKCIIGQKQEIFPIISLLPKSFFFLKSLTIGDENIVKKLRKHQHYICSQDVESLITPNINNWTLRRYSSYSVKNSDLIFFNSKEHLNDFQKNFNKEKKFLKIVGNPLIYCSRYKSKKIKKNNKIKKNVLIISSFSYLNTSIGRKNFNDTIKNLTPYNFKNSMEKNNYNYLIEIIKKNKKYHSTFFNKFYEMCSYIIKNNKNYNFIIKPHPAENISNWKKIEINYPNVKVDAHSKLDILLQNNEILIHPNSTVAVEAFFYKKKIIMFNDKKKYPFAVSKLNQKISYYVSKKQEVSSFFEKDRKKANINYLIYSNPAKKIIGYLKKKNINSNITLNYNNFFIIFLFYIFNLIKIYFLLPFLGLFKFNKTLNYKFGYATSHWTFGYNKKKKLKWSSLTEHEIEKLIYFYSNRKINKNKLKIIKNPFGFYSIEKK